MIRVLGIAPFRLKSSLSCLGEDQHGARVEMRVDLRQNKEHWSLPFASHFFNCRLRGNFRPVKVSHPIFLLLC